MIDYNAGFDEFIQKNPQLIENCFTKAIPGFLPGIQPKVRECLLYLTNDKETPINFNQLTEKSKQHIAILIYLFIEYTRVRLQSRVGYYPNHQIDPDKHFYFSDFLKTLKQNIHESLKIRTPIKQKVYNYLTGGIEYELEDGSFIQITTESASLKSEIQINHEIFPNSILKSLDPQNYRDKQIKNIIT